MSERISFNGRILVVSVPSKKTLFLVDPLSIFFRIRLMTYFLFLFEVSRYKTCQGKRNQNKSIFFQEMFKHTYVFSLDSVST